MTDARPAAARLPLRLLLDEEFEWCNFEWDAAHVPRPGRHAATAARRAACRSASGSTRTSASTRRSSTRAAARAIFVKTADGGVWQRDQWQAGHGHRGLHQPGGRALVRRTPARACSTAGVDCFKTDFGERIPTDVVYHDGSDPARMHNFYPILYNKAVFEVLEEARGTGEAVVFARSATRRRPAVPRALGRRLLVDLRVHGGEPARRAVARPVRLRLLEPRHRRVRGDGRRQTSTSAGSAFGLLSSHSRLHGSASLPRAVALRRGGLRRRCAPSRS